MKTQTCSNQQRLIFLKRVVAAILVLKRKMHRMKEERESSTQRFTGFTNGLKGAINVAGTCIPYNSDEREEGCEKEN